MDIDQWRNKYGEHTDLTIEQVIEFHLEELQREIDYFDKHKQQHIHQDVWIRFLKSLLEGKKPKREAWSVWG